MKSFLVSVLLLLYLLIPEAKSSHLVGANSTYEYNPFSTVFKVKLYQDCSGTNGISVSF